MTVKSGDKDKARTATSKPAGRRTTLMDIAADAGVSRATVSLVLRNSPQIPAATRARVQHSMDKLRYVYNRGAASLRTDMSQTVGVIVPDIMNPYFAEMVSAIEDALSSLRRIPFLHNSREDLGRQELFINAMHEHNVDGVFLCPASDTPASLFEWFRQARLPVVQISRFVSDAATDYVGPDNERGVRDAVQHLITLGHRRIAFIGANPSNSTGREREQGWRNALAAADLPQDPQLVISCPATRDDGMQAVLRLLGQPQPPTAAMCFNDVLAFGVMLGLRYMDLEPGVDFSVIGCDAIAETALWRPALTSIAIPNKIIGAKAAEVLMGRVTDRDGEFRHLVIEPTLVIRASCRPPKKVSRRRQ